MQFQSKCFYVLINHNKKIYITNGSFKCYCMIAEKISLKSRSNLILERKLKLKGYISFCFIFLEICSSYFPFIKYLFTRIQFFMFRFLTFLHNFFLCKRESGAVTTKCGMTPGNEFGVKNGFSGYPNNSKFSSFFLGDDNNLANENKNIFEKPFQAMK